MTTIWLDILCINQSDTEEKNSQVSSTREIYEKSTEAQIIMGTRRDMLGIRRSKTTIGILGRFNKRSQVEDFPTHQRGMQIAQHPYWGRAWYGSFSNPTKEL
jgi:hypothetical protein